MRRNMASRVCLLGFLVVGCGSASTDQMVVKSAPGNAQRLD